MIHHAVFVLLGKAPVGVIVEIGKTIGKAVVAGVGVELARLASGHLRDRFGVKEHDKKHDDAQEKQKQEQQETQQKAETQADRLERDLEQVKRENAELKREIEALKAQRRG